MSSKRIIVINGSGGSGKDTFVEMCSGFTDIINISSIDPVKESLSSLVGIDYVEGVTEKTEELRKLMSDLKQISVQFNDYPFKWICGVISNFSISENMILFIHCRESSEINKIINYAKENYPDIITESLLVKSSRVKPIESNASDRDVNDYPYDYLIQNDCTLDDLRNKAYVFINELK